MNQIALVHRARGREAVRDELLHNFDFHTLVRLRTGIFYAAGRTSTIFVVCYKSGRRHERIETDRFRRFAHSELVAREKVNLDIFWLKDNPLDDPDLLPPPEKIAAEIVENLEAALDRFRKVALSLQAGEGV
jgi:type I restriction enzyme M protein